MKKTVCLFLIFVFCLALLAACGEVPAENTAPAATETDIEGAPSNDR